MPALVAILMGWLLSRFVDAYEIHPPKRLEMQLLLILFVFQGVARGPGINRLLWAEAGMLLWSSCAIVMILLCWRQKNTPGMGLIALGVGLNVAVILANSGMPVVGLLSATAVHHPMTTADLLPLLADIHPSPGGYMLSLGDLVAMVGAVTFSVTQFAQSGSAAGAETPPRVVRIPTTE